MDSVFTKANFAPKITNLSRLSLQSVETGCSKDEPEFHISSLSEYILSPSIAIQEYNI